MILSLTEPSYQIVTVFAEAEAVFAEAEAVFAEAEAGLAVAMLARQDRSKPSVHSERYQVRDVCLAAEQRPALRGGSGWCG